MERPSFGELPAWGNLAKQNIAHRLSARLAGEKIDEYGFGFGNERQGDGGATRKNDDDVLVHRIDRVEQAQLVVREVDRRTVVPFAFQDVREAEEQEHFLRFGRQVNRLKHQGIVGLRFVEIIAFRIGDFLVRDGFVEGNDAVSPTETRSVSLITWLFREGADDSAAGKGR